MKNSQHIFVVECSESSKSDWNYVRKLLASAYFQIDFQATKLSPIYLNGKQSYASKEKEVNSAISRYAGTTYVYYVFDVDRGLTKDKDLNNKIAAYIDETTFNKGVKANLIWFNKNIELVVLGRSVADSKKVEEAQNFYTGGSYPLAEANMERLLAEEFPTRGQSNFLSVLYRSLPKGKKTKTLLESIAAKKAKKKAKRK